ncbi:glycoside hydrolase family 88 protein [Parabacteroides goldsteinii]|uniref:glycoside hydrolase family 88 protein n=1 Tax=Parabacteroides goldsteinii TaxID=328812 RepID=UPI00241DBF93|nr:glycoside hydrolase family 88 protein [Parabacteroides goldsteinii]
MKKTALFCCFLMVLSVTGCNQRKDTEESFIQENVNFASEQMQLLLNSVGEYNGKNYPRTTDAEGRLVSTSRHDWTPGFFPGALWYLYELTGDKKWVTYAEKWTYPLEPHKSFTGNHDIGFMMYCSYGNAERLAPKEGYQDILIESANSLCTRFDERVQAIESWDYRKAWDGSEWFYPVIIDNMMNLELLFYVSRITGDTKYHDIAVAHANTTLKYHFRDDYSSYHVVDYDTITGQPLHRQTCQGYSDNSTWSRGQAWAVYGYTMMYRETKYPVYLEAAENFADYFIRHLPDDLVPMWDFNVGEAGFTPGGDSYAKEFKGEVRDASAAAIVCSALFELGEFSANKAYTEMAVRMLKSLSSPDYRAPLGGNADFIIMHCTGSLPHKSEIDVPLIYADYYYLEALTRYKHLINKQNID